MFVPARCTRSRYLPLILIAVGCAGGWSGEILAQEPTGCQFVNKSAGADFDFTEALSRWGTPGAYDMDAAPHTVRSIAINRLPIFDEANPKEDRLLYRWANDLHIYTRPTVISQQLLFEENSVVNSQNLAESERLLRKQKYLGDARIRVLQDCDTVVDLEVVTREVWSLTPEVSFKSTGGHSSSGVGIRDSNFLGTGQYIDLNYKTDQERSSYGLTYKNPNVAGGRHIFSTELATNSDGHHYGIDTGLPFFALDSQNAWNLRADDVSEVLNQYAFGERVSHLQHDTRMAEVSYGISKGLTDDHVQRLSAGLRTESHTLQQTDGLPAPVGYRPSLDLSYPFVQYEYIENRFTQGFNISLIQRTEDLHVGRYLRSRVGYAPGNDGSVIFDTQYADTLIYQPKVLLQVHADFKGRWDQGPGSLQDSLFQASLDYHRGQTTNRSLFLGLQYNKAFNLTNGRQLELGGNNGLRAFDTHFLQGESSVQFTAEERVFTNLHLLQLLRVGFAAYYDVGRVFGGTLPGTDTVYQNVGVGLRLAPSRSEAGQIIHIDLAYPLNSAVPGGRDIQVIAQVKKSF